MRPDSLKRGCGEGGCVLDGKVGYEMLLKVVDLIPCRGHAVYSCKIQQRG